MAGLKGERDIRDALGRRLSRTYARDVCGVEAAWPYVLSLGRPTKQQILAGFRSLDALMGVLRGWEDKGLVRVEYAMREAGGPKRLPVRMEVLSLDAAARIASPRDGERWASIVRRTRRRCELLREAIPELADEDRARVIRAEDGCDDLEFELLLAAGVWFRFHDARGMTPREVPLPGIDSKWLNSARRQSLLCLLADKDDLGLAARPPSLEFAYLDPSHLAWEGRRYDSWVRGDVSAVAYEPSVVIIVENKDTYLNFPQVEDGICVFGAGKAGQALAGELAWVRKAERVLYWGDLDADGFEILDGYRARGISCTSILMDRATLERFDRFGTDVEKDHRTALVRERKSLPHLTDEERATYDLITSPDYEGHRRLEQEKIPLSEALHALEQA